MTDFQFKTNFKCSGCVDKIAPILNENSQISQWKVDLQSSEKTLYIQTDLQAEEISQIIEKQGFKIEEIKKARV